MCECKNINTCIVKQKLYNIDRCGEVAEWSNARDSKSCIRATVSGVQIPPSPPERFISHENI